MNRSRVSVETFELDRHAVVEASAGTGKTFTIERLVARLLTEEAVPIEQILVVTYTEKATGELKERLRRMIERELQHADLFTPLLQAALHHFDQAPIFTIHAFCQRLLQEYALEQGQDFAAMLIDDADLLQRALCEIQRKLWRSTFGAKLKAVLERALYDRTTAATWDRKVLEVAKKYKPRSGHRLQPAFVPDWWQRLDDPALDCAGQLELFTIHAMHAHIADHKRQRGLQSFDDMIARVEESLDPVRNSDAANLVQVLRTRFRYGIVDEFQDTDPLQWSIFRRIFLEGGDSRLFVVGDPKQAIFNFRGADLPTYQKAVMDMEAQFDAAFQSLDTNWRSEPDLLEGLNCLFGDGEWFPKDTGITYHYVSPPDDDRRESRVEIDRTGRAPLTIVDMSEFDRLKLAHKKYARFIAHEIQQLLGTNGSPLWTIVQKSSPSRPIDASDIAILILKRKEAEPIMQALDEAGIPHSFYKQTGFWHSPEALHLEQILHMLARPEAPESLRKALLTCFFRVQAVELLRSPDVPTHHPARKLFHKWVGHAENRQWSALCRSLVEEQ